MAPRPIKADNQPVPYRAQPRRLRSSRLTRRNSAAAPAAGLPAPARASAAQQHGLPACRRTVQCARDHGRRGRGVAAATGATAVTIDYLSEGLPDVTNFEELDYAQPSVVYDRTGTVELARFQSERRHVVTFEEIPKLVLDATIAVEDRSFWDNEGYDPNAIASAIVALATGGGDRGGGSTITQQFVRARLLPQDVLDGDVYIRKAKEIIQSSRLTAAFPGEAGKARIITAYLNQIYYGHNAYGIAAAAQVYFGITDLNQLTPAQAALLAGLPQSPTDYDLFKAAQTRRIRPAGRAGGRRAGPTAAHHRGAAQLHPAQSGRRQRPLDNAHAGAARPGPQRADRPCAGSTDAVARAALHLAHEARARCAAGVDGPRPRRQWRLLDHHLARYEGAEPGRALRHGGRHRHPVTEG